MTLRPAQDDATTPLPEDRRADIGWQYVEGFDRIVSAPGGPTWSVPAVEPGFDFRGQSRGWWTPAPWVRAEGEDLGVVWLTAAVPDSRPTVFVLAVATSNQPHNRDTPCRAHLSVNGLRALTFDLGLRIPWRWREGDFALDWTPKRAQMPFDGWERQSEMHGNSGRLELEVPASDVTADQPCTLRVELEPETYDRDAFFMVKERRDMLEVSPRTNDQQIEALQRDVIQLQRSLNALARRVYPELQTNQLQSEESIIFSAGREHANGPDLARTADGRLLVVWRAALEHMAADGHIRLITSDDRGRTWSSPREVGRCPWPVDSRDPVLHPLPDGTVMLTWFSYTAYDNRGERRAPRSGERIHETLLIRSSDGGRTWTQEPETIDPGPLDWIVVHAPAVELPDGRLLLPCSTCNHPQPSASVFVSDDGGQSWRFHAMIGDIPVPARYPETTLARTPSGKLVALVRIDRGNQLQSVSEDDGRTWTDWIETPLPSYGHRARLITLDSGELLCSYGRRLRREGALDDATSIRLAVSFDEGATWDVRRNTRILRDDLLNGDIGYPVTVPLSGDEFLTVYWFNQFQRLFVATNRWRKWWNQ